MEPITRIIYHNKKQKPHPQIEAQLNPKHLWLSTLAFITDNGKWHKVKDVVNLIKRWRIQELVLSYNHHSPLLKEISPIEFPDLESIFLSYNSLESIEIVSRIRFPSLRQCQLSKIYTIKVKTPLSAWNPFGRLMYLFYCLSTYV